jgi:hypothetical protein
VVAFLLFFLAAVRFQHQQPRRAVPAVRDKLGGTGADARVAGIVIFPFLKVVEKNHAAEAGQLCVFAEKPGVFFVWPGVKQDMRLVQREAFLKIADKVQLCQALFRPGALFHTQHP